MKVKNIGGKIVSIGNTTILPGEVKPVPDSFADNAAVSCLVKHKNIELIRSEEAEPAAEEPPAEDHPAEEPPAGAPPTEEPPAEDHPAGNSEPDKKPLSRMNKSELVEKCRKLGIEVRPDDTNQVLVDKIKAATAG